MMDSNFDRRNFLGAAMAGAGLLSNLKAMSAASKPPAQFENKLSLKILGTNWGFSGNYDALCAALKKEGYDGVEVGWPGSADKQAELLAALQKHDLHVGFLSGAGEKDFASHFASFKKYVSAAATQFSLKPLYVNCHSGKDYFTYEQNKAIIDFTAELTAKAGVPVYHETHRGRMLFAAHITRNFIEKSPSLKLTLDISHWCNVHESLLADQAETVELALSRVGHIHARIGHEQGPQVNDPRAPEWEATVKAHLGWWDKVVANKARAGEPLTILTEFGPPNYLPTVPYTTQPLADQWAINVYMMKLLRERYLK